MKRAAVLLALLCMLTVSASASYIPEDVVSENRDGRQLIIKTYTLSPDANPSELVEPPFDLEGFTYFPASQSVDRSKDDRPACGHRADPGMRSEG